MKTTSRTLPLLVLAAAVRARAGDAPPSADELMKALDRNMVFDTRVADVKMTITKDGRETVKELHMQSRGFDTSFVEFTAPARDKGTRYLKLDRNLWMYLPGAEKQVKISGHMLRQSLMGSDFSYEDMLESPDMSGRYDATIAGDEALDGKACWVLALKAKQPDVTYPARKVWITKDQSVPVKEELYALTGKLMKEELLQDVTQFSEKAPDGSTRTRHFPTRIVMKNLLQQGTQTQIQFLNVQFGVPLGDDVFSLQSLGRGN